jgi:hypothetical protein
MKHQNFAMASKETHYSVNHGRPTVAATFKAGEFGNKGNWGAKGPGSPTSFGNGAHTDSTVHGNGPGQERLIKPNNDPGAFKREKFGDRRDPRLKDPNAYFAGKPPHAGPYGSHGGKSHAEDGDRHRRDPRQFREQRW